MGTTIVFRGVHDVRVSVEEMSSVGDHTLKVIDLCGEDDSPVGTVTARNQGLMFLKKLDDSDDKTGVILTTRDISARDLSFPRLSFVAFV